MATNGLVSGYCQAEDHDKCKCEEFECWCRCHRFLVHPVCERLESGTPVGVRLRCRRDLCRTEWDGSAEVVNAYGVRDVIPGSCPKCGLWAHDVTEIVEVGS